MHLKYIVFYSLASCALSFLLERDKLVTFTFVFIIVSW